MRLPQSARVHADTARAWVVFLLAPTAGSGVAYSVLALLRVSHVVVLAQSTDLDELLGSLSLLIAGGIAGMLLLGRGRQRVVGVDATVPSSGYWFPGPLLGGLALILAPLLMLAGELVRIKYYFYYPMQLRAAAAYPQLMATSYGLFALGLLLQWPAFLALTRLIGERLPAWAGWGGTLAITGEMIRLFHEGVDYLSFQLVNDAGLTSALHAVAASYQHWYVFYPLVFTDNLGWAVLAIGAYRSGRVGWALSLGIAVMAFHSSGVLKGSSLGSSLETLALCAGFVPLGIHLLQQVQLSRRARYAALLVCLTLAALYAYTAWNLTTRPSSMSITTCPRPAWSRHWPTTACAPSHAEPLWPPVIPELATTFPEPSGPRSPTSPLDRIGGRPAVIDRAATPSYG